MCDDDEQRMRGGSQTHSGDGTQAVDAAAVLDDTELLRFTDDCRAPVPPLLMLLVSEVGDWGLDDDCVGLDGCCTTTHRQPEQSATVLVASGRITAAANAAGVRISGISGIWCEEGHKTTWK